jgi:hypothetical protein
MSVVLELCGSRIRVEAGVPVKARETLGLDELHASRVRQSALSLAPAKRAQIDHRAASRVPLHRGRLGDPVRAAVGR